MKTSYKILTEQAFQAFDKQKAESDIKRYEMIEQFFKPLHNKYESRKLKKKDCVEQVDTFYKENNIESYKPVQNKYQTNFLRFLFNNYDSSEFKKRRLTDDIESYENTIYYNALKERVKNKEPFENFSNDDRTFLSYYYDSRALYNIYQFSEEDIMKYELNTYVITALETPSFEILKWGLKHNWNILQSIKTPSDEIIKYYIDNGNEYNIRLENVELSDSMMMYALQKNIDLLTQFKNPKKEHYDFFIQELQHPKNRSLFHPCIIMRYQMYFDDCKLPDVKLDFTKVLAGIILMGYGINLKEIFRH